MRAALALALLAVAGCSPEVQTVSVAQVIAQCDGYKGKPVMVEGYIGECGGYGCLLFDDKAAAADPIANRGSAIGVGANDDFDRKAASLQNKDVVVTGTMAKDNCTGEGGTDRSAGLIPTDIRAWTPPGGAPANSGGTQ